jgi:hypothetical protein
VHAEEDGGQDKEEPGALSGSACYGARFDKLRPPVRLSTGQFRTVALTSQFAGEQSPHHQPKSTSSRGHRAGLTVADGDGNGLKPLGSSATT